MPRQCAITGKTPKFGRSYALRGIAKKKKGIGLKITGCTNRRFLPNLMTKKIWDPEKKCYIRLRCSAAALRTMDKNGVSSVLRKVSKR